MAIRTQIAANRNQRLTAGMGGSMHPALLHGTVVNAVLNGRYEAVPESHVFRPKLLLHVKLLRVETQVTTIDVILWLPLHSGPFGLVGILKTGFWI